MNSKSFDEAMREEFCARMYAPETRLGLPAVGLYQLIGTWEEHTADANPEYRAHWERLAPKTLEWLEHTFPEVVQLDAEGEEDTFCLDGPFLELFIHASTATVAFKRWDRETEQRRWAHPQKDTHGFLLVACSLAMSVFTTHEEFFEPVKQTN